jgi:ribosomal protein S18 acetylase RimI-like enzyme
MHAITVEEVRDPSRLTRVAPGVFDDAPRADLIAQYLASPGHHLVLAFDGDLVVGQVAAVVHRHCGKAAELYLDEVGVADGYLRRGIATRMVEAMLAIGREAGCEACWLGTEQDNGPARALYARWQPAPARIMMYDFPLGPDGTWSGDLAA